MLPSVDDADHRAAMLRKFFAFSLSSALPKLAKPKFCLERATVQHRALSLTYPFPLDERPIAVVPSDWNRLCEKGNTFVLHCVARHTAMLVYDPSAPLPPKVNATRVKQWYCEYYREAHGVDRLTEAAQYHLDLVCTYLYNDLFKRLHEQLIESSLVALFGVDPRLDYQPLHEPARWFGATFMAALRWRDALDELKLKRRRTISMASLFPPGTRIERDANIVETASVFVEMTRSLLRNHYSQHMFQDLAVAMHRVLDVPVYARIADPLTVLRELRVKLKQEGDMAKQAAWDAGLEDFVRGKMEHIVRTEVGDVGLAPMVD